LAFDQPLQVNEELGIPELKKLLAAAQREITVLKTQISTSAPLSGELDDNLDCPQSESDAEEDPTSSETFPIRIAELEDLLENQRIRLNSPSLLRSLVIAP
jgi:hypothetical protein